MEKAQAECLRCGTCCTKGGPALHTEDLHLIKEGRIALDRLITIRKGELVYKPDNDKPQSARCELIKISGTGIDWQCFYFDSGTKGCNIYLDRPVSCIALQCWDTAAVEELVEKDTITRFDIVAVDHPVYAAIVEHERVCPCPDMELLAAAVQAGSYPELKALEDLVNDDIRVRTESVKKYRLSLAEELLYFGRPLFQLLQQIGVGVTEVGGRLILKLAG